MTGRSDIAPATGVFVSSADMREWAEIARVDPKISAMFAKAAETLATYEEIHGRPVAAPMPLDRALAIVAAVNDRCFYTMELVDKVGSLADVSLADMIEAARLVRERNSAAPSVDGKRTIHVVPDDRLIAAAYCLDHYPPSNESIAIIPHMSWAHETELKALAVVPLKRSACNSGEGA